ncbi:MAG: DUF3048 domain-containing protein [Actinomycetes bacterium]
MADRVGPIQQVDRRTTEQTRILIVFEGRVLRRSVVSVAAAALALTACGGSDESPKAADKAPDSSSPPEPVRQPFTGEMVDVVPKGGSLTVKIDNTDAAQPQAGLAGADLVFEELVEGGITRLAAVFYGTKPEQVGPVRSMRTSDIGIVAPTRGMLAASGAASRPARAIKAADIPTATPGKAGFSRDGQRRAPYNLMLKPSELQGRLEKLPPPPDYFVWAEPDATAPTGKPAKKVSVKFSPFHTTDWTFRAGAGWTRQQELAGKRPFPVTNLLALSVKVRDAGYRDVAGNPVPETVLEGSGKAWLFREGKVVTARWSKQEPAAQLELTGADGAPLPLPVGRTWVELVPTTGGVSTR